MIQLAYAVKPYFIDFATFVFAVFESEIRFAHLAMAGVLTLDVQMAPPIDRGRVKAYPRTSPRYMNY